MMKKCGTILIISLLTALFYSCRQERATGNTTPQEAIADATLTEQQTTAPEKEFFRICDTLHLAVYDKQSPALVIEIELEDITLSTPTATAKAISDISYNVTNEELQSLSEACNRKVAALRAIYSELSAKYINQRSHNNNPHWLNHTHTIKGHAEEGYKGFVNYKLDFFEYTGGAHPNSYCIALVFDPADGHEVVLQEIMTENYEEPLLALITEELKRHFDVTTVEELYNGHLFPDVELYVTNNFILDKECITFIYNRYDIAPYAEGEIILNIEYEKLKHLLK